MSGVAIIIQELSSTMDDMADKLSVSRLRFYQSIISDLMHVRFLFSLMNMNSLILTYLICI